MLSSRFFKRIGLWAEGGLIYGNFIVWLSPCGDKVMETFFIITPTILGLIWGVVDGIVNRE